MAIHESMRLEVWFAYMANPDITHLLYGVSDIVYESLYDDGELDHATEQLLTMWMCDGEVL